MDEKLTSSVGARGRNNLLDVIKVQVMLKLLHRGEGGTGPYYKQKIDGIVGGATTAAIQLFAKHHLGRLSEAEQKKYQKKNTAIFEPGSAMTKELQSYAEGPRFLKQAAVIPGTAILYKHLGTSISEANYLVTEYLVPSSLSIPLERELKNIPFKYSYKEVWLDGYTDKFFVKLAFPNVEFFDVLSLKLSKKLPSKFRAMVASAARKAPWELAANNTDNTAVQIATKKPTGLYSAYLQLDQKGPIGRVISDEKMRLIIPEKKQLLRVVAHVYAAACYVKGGKIEKQLVGEYEAKLAEEIMKRIPKDADVKIEQICKSCRQLGDEWQQLIDANVELAISVGESTAAFHRFVSDETIVRQFEGEIASLHKELVKLLIDISPLPLDSSYVDHGNVSISTSDALKGVGHALQSSSSVSVAASGKTLVRTINVADKIIALVKLGVIIARMVELATTDSLDYLEDLKKIQKSYSDYREVVESMYRQLDTNDLEIVKKVESMKGQGCDLKLVGMSKALQKDGYIPQP